MVLLVAGQLALAPGDEPPAAGLLAAGGQPRRATPSPAAGMRPMRSTAGIEMACGTGWCRRQVAARQARQYGVKTR